VLIAQARFEEAAQCRITARELAEKMGDVVAEARAWNGLAFLQERLGENQQSIRSARRAEELIRNAGLSTPEANVELIRALHLRGWACYRLGDAPGVLSLADYTERLCLECGERQRLAVSYKLRGVAYLQLGRFSDARRCFQQGLNLCEELGDRRNGAAMLSNLGETARLLGDFQRAALFYEQALNVSGNWLPGE
jgi:tetratricopeptide (TPR) repeat protein